MCGVFVSHQPILQQSGHRLGVLQLSSVLTLTTQSWQRPQRSRGSILQDGPHFRCQSFKSRVPRWPTLLRLQSQRVLTTPFSRFDNFLEWFTKLWKTLFLLLPVHCKGCTRTARCRGTWDKVRRFPVFLELGCATLPVRRCVLQLWSSPNLLFKGFYADFITRHWWFT